MQDDYNKILCLLVINVEWQFLFCIYPAVAISVVVQSRPRLDS